mmetsp:Transcript_160243/g.514123  ORF Transcript_160243/g.514123 Transcript_160243/m.514123 type:complete len:502 (-) Transcript_160243:90-1595(-)
MQTMAGSCEGQAQPGQLDLPDAAGAAANCPCEDVRDVLQACEQTCQSRRPSLQVDQHVVALLFGKQLPPSARLLLHRLFQGLAVDCGLNATGSSLQMHVHASGNGPVLSFVSDELILGTWTLAAPELVPLEKGIRQQPVQETSRNEDLRAEAIVDLPRDDEGRAGVHDFVCLSGREPPTGSDIAVEQKFSCARCVEGPNGVRGEDERPVELAAVLQDVVYLDERRGPLDSNFLQLRCRFAGTRPEVDRCSQPNLGICRGRDAPPDAQPPRCQHGHLLAHWLQHVSEPELVTCDFRCRVSPSAQPMCSICISIGPAIVRRPMLHSVPLSDQLLNDPLRREFCVHTVNVKPTVSLDVVLALGRPRREDLQPFAFHPVLAQVQGDHAATARQALCDTQEPSAEGLVTSCFEPLGVGCVLPGHEVASMPRKLAPLGILVRGCASRRLRRSRVVLRGGHHVLDALQDLARGAARPSQPLSNGVALGLEHAEQLHFFHTQLIFIAGS